MASINAYSAQLTLSLLEDTTTVLTSPGSAETGTVGEAFGGFPQKVAGSASDVNIKLGSLTDPLILAGFHPSKGLIYLRTAIYLFAISSDFRRFRPISPPVFRPRGTRQNGSLFRAFRGIIPLPIGIFSTPKARQIAQFRANSPFAAHR